MAVYEELIVDQGSTFKYQLNLTNPTTGDAYNLAGFTVNAYMKKNYKSVSPAGIFGTELDGVPGRINLSLTDEQTSAIKAGRYFFDVIIESPTGEVFRIVEGIVDVTPAITIITP